MQRITFEGHDIDRNVDHTVLGVGGDDAAKRRTKTKLRLAVPAVTVGDIINT